MSLVIPLDACIARPDQGEKKYHLIDHLEDVATRSGNHRGGSEGRLLFLAGLLHDIGKGQRSWQLYIESSHTQKKGVPHAFLGAALFFGIGIRAKTLWAGENDNGLYDNLVIQTTADIADHHGILKDLHEHRPPWLGGWRAGCIEETDLPGVFKLVAKWFPDLTEILVDLPRDESNMLTTLRHQWRRSMIAMLARPRLSMGESLHAAVAARVRTSRLIAGDRFSVADIDTDSIDEDLAAGGLDHLAVFCRDRANVANRETASTLTEMRNRAQNDAAARFLGSKPTSFYTLDLPTGLGKTLTSLRVALEAGRLGRISRIIYVAPYLSILSQAAKEIREASGIEVMEHHHLSLLDAHINHESEPIDSIVVESWQAPIVATTFNQLFLALCPRGAQQTIRIPALKKAFVILDEPQVIDPDVWKLFLHFIGAVAKEMQMMCLFVTATLPPLDSLPQEPTKLSTGDLRVPSRYQLVVQSQPEDEDSLADKAVRAAQRVGTVGVILNTISDAARVYDKTRADARPDVDVFNLHGAMTSLHKQYQIKQIKKMLSSDKKVIVVATQIIEAGVDLSFRQIFRARSIIPSIIQTGGRANRHAARDEPLAEVVDFDFMRDGRPTRGWIYEKISMAITDSLLEGIKDLHETSMPALCREYFVELFQRRPGTSSLAYVEEAARGTWSSLHGLQPFQEKDYRLSVFVPNMGSWIDQSTHDLLRLWRIEDGDDLYDRYRDSTWMAKLSFQERKLFIGLLQRFTVPMAFQVVRQIANIAETPEDVDPRQFTFKLMQPELYRPDMGFGNIAKDVDEWISI